MFEIGRTMFEIGRIMFEIGRIMSSMIATINWLSPSSFRLRPTIRKMPGLRPRMLAVFFYISVRSYRH